MLLLLTAFASIAWSFPTYEMSITATLDTSHGQTGNIRCLDIYEDCIFFCDEDSGIVAINVSDKYNPVEIGSYDPGGYPCDPYITSDGHYLICTSAPNQDSSVGPFIIDISDPTNMQTVANMQSGSANAGHGGWLGSNEEFFYSCGYRDDTFYVYNVSNKESPTGLVGSVHDVLLDGVHDCEGYYFDDYGKYVFCSTHWGGNDAYDNGVNASFVSINVTDPTNPVIEDSYTGFLKHGTAAELLILDNNIYFFMSTGLSGPNPTFNHAVCFNVTNPKSCTLEDECDDDYTYAYRATLRRNGGKMLFGTKSELDDNEPDIFRLNVTNPSHITLEEELNVYTGSAYVQDVLLDPDEYYLYFTVEKDGSHDFGIIDIGNGTTYWLDDDPENPENIIFQSVNDQNNGSVLQDQNRTFNWTKVDGATKYQLQISNSSTFDTTFVNLADINETNYGANYNDVGIGDYVEFILPDQYNVSWYGYHYYQVRAYTT